MERLILFKKFRLLIFFFSTIFLTILASAIPNVPSNLEANPVSPTQINLQWQDNSLIEDGFIIERVLAIKDTSSLLARILNRYKISGEWQEIADVGAKSGVGTAIHIDTKSESNNLIPYTSYFYRVKAYNSIGNSEYSNQALTKTLAYCTDTDNGKIYNVAGTATSNAPKPYYSSITDFCSSTYVKEASCTNEGIIAITSYKCADGCMTTQNGGKCN